MNPIKFHILEFPDDVVILLDDSFRKLLFTAAVSKAGSVKKLANKLGCNYRMIYSWKNARNGISKSFIPLPIVKRIIGLIESDAREKILPSSFARFSRLYELFKNKKKITSKDVTNKLDVTHSTAQWTLQKLVKEGFLTKRGRKIHRDKNGRIILQEYNKYFLSKKGKMSINEFKKIENSLIEEIKKHIIIYKTFSGKNDNVRNPKLPIIETPQLMAIIVNLICDGSELKGAGEYSNAYIELIKNFERNLKYVFGDVKTKIYYIKKNGNFILRFPKIILNIIKKFYNIEFGTFTGRLPARLFELPKEYAAYAIRAAFDDEGHVSDNSINFTSSNKLLISDLKELLSSKFPEISKFVYIENGKGYFRLHIKSGALKYFSRNIGLNHPKKINELNFQIERMRKGRLSLKPKEIKRNMLFYLDATDYATTKDMCKYLFTKNNTTLRHLFSLKNNDYIDMSKIKHKGISYKWKITEKGREVLHGGD